MGVTDTEAGKVLWVEKTILRRDDSKIEKLDLKNGPDYQ